MSAITRFNPFRKLGRFDPFGSEMDGGFKVFLFAPMSFNQASARLMSVDVTETGNVITTE